MTQNREQILAAGFDGYQTKPISVREFLETVRAVLDRNPGTKGVS
jgi:DNA-binding response OmpR family regulator